METPRPDKIEEDQVPTRVYLEAFTGTTKWWDNGRYQNDGDRIKVIIYPEVPPE